MFTTDREILSFRTLAILPPVLFAPSMISFFVAPGVGWVEYPGMLFHLSILFLISRMDAPEWAKAAGYGWIAIDVLTGVLSINQVPDSIAWPVRLGGHVLAGVWILTASLLARSRGIQIVGVITGAWLSLYSFCSHYLPAMYLFPQSFLMYAWFILLALYYDRSQPAANRGNSLSALSR